MSDLEDSFLQEIARQPHDWLPRLIFADWLEEHGDSRGELIRLFHQLTRLACARRSQKEARLQELSAAGVVWPSPALMNSPDMKFVLIPPGQFRMGSPDSEPAHEDNETQVDVTLTQGFWLGQYAVTQSEYETVMGQNPSEFTWRNLNADSNRHPVEMVSWDEAVEFYGKLTTQERAAGRLASDWEYTLPIESQWEYACRAGTTTATAFGDGLSSTQANFSGRRPYNGAEAGEFIAQTVAVGSYRANGWSLYDMHGNDWEWCRDWNADKLPGGTDPEVVETATNRVICGGCCDRYGRNCRSATRYRCAPDYRFNILSFRLAAVQTR